MAGFHWNFAVSESSLGEFRKLEIQSRFQGNTRNALSVSPQFYLDYVQSKCVFIGDSVPFPITVTVS